MTSIGSDLEHVLVTEREQWRDGPPHELFKRAAQRVPGALDRRRSPSTPTRTATGR